MSLVSEFLGQLTLNFGGSEEEKSPTVRPAEDFDADKDAARIETAIKTKGVDEQTIIDILTRRSYSQRRDIAFAYERRTKKDMISALKGALKGPLESVILGLMKSTAQFDASELKNSMKGLGTDEVTLVELVCSRSNSEMQEIKKVYKEMFDRYKSYSPYDMKESIKKEVKGDMENAFLTLVQCIENKPLYFASRLNDSMQGCPYEMVDQCLKTRGIPPNQEHFMEYKVQCIENKPLYFASRLNDSMQSKGAKDKLLTRIMVSRCEVDLLKIRTEFKKQYSKSLYQTISASPLGLPRILGHFFGN
ncbi:UNVERIFIED_CONTAM: hypothetical protein FKN15_066881 [Acipenser sinensis]